MKKKNTAKQVSISPENYIRQKSKSLPIYKCFINKDWKSSGMGTIFITRQHKNGNVTVCIYLVDISCLGVKDSFYRFNLPFEEVEKMMGKIKDIQLSFTEVPYELVHNIIYASVEFAEEYGFKPCKVFNLVTSYFLEDDTDDIPLIEIKCGGQDGKPFYVDTGVDEPARVKEIMAQLEKKAGEGNYNFIVQSENFSLDKEIDKDKKEDDKKKYKKDEIEEIKEDIALLSKEQQEELFLELYFKDKKSQNLTDKEFKQLAILIEILCYDMSDDEAIDKEYERLEEMFDYPYVEIDAFPNSLFTGIENKDEETALDAFSEALENISKKKKPTKAIELIRKKSGDIPVVDFLNLFYLNLKDPKKFVIELEKSYQKYPSYFLIQVLYNTKLSKDVKEMEKRLENLLSIQTQDITQYEMEYFFFTYAVPLLADENIDVSTVIALDEYLHEADFINEHVYSIIFMLIHVVKLMKIMDHISKSKK